MQYVISDRVPQGAFERLEPLVWKLTCSVLRGACGLVTVLRAGNSPRLPDLAALSQLSGNQNLNQVKF
ncbi:hypothetical protein GMMP15_560081 [Candidatus Magnetomoraceae bacterium gMMP-15]